MAAIDIKALGKTYSQHPVITDLNLSIQQGEFIVIVGPSGCGKSSLLRMIAGLEDVTMGDIYINQQRVNHVEPKDRNIAMVFQNYALYPHMSVYKNMAYGLRMRKTPKAEIKQRIHDVAKMLELDQVLDRLPKELSGGQRQRVAMGRAMVRKPAIFLFDEPLSNLDAKLRVQMRLEIRNLQQRLKTTSIYVTHDQVEAMTLADRIVVMNEGKIEQVGTPEEIYQQPASIFVAEFIGSPSINLITVDLADPHLPECIKKAIPETIKGKAILGIRPENFILKSVQSSATLTVRVENIEILGAEKYVYAWLGEGHTQPITFKIAAGEPIKLGEMIHVAFVNAKSIWFDDKHALYVH